MATKSRSKTKTVKKTVTTAVEEPKQTNTFIENYGSTILGFIVVLVLGSFLFNVFRNSNRQNNGQVGQGEQTTEQSTENNTGTTEEQTHTVAKGEDLWKIAEKYYKSGYNWVDIAKANNITNANQIEEGQKLVIPAAKAIVVGQDIEATPTAIVISPAATITQPEVVTAPTEQEKGSTSETYTIVKGDNLWKIAIKVYNDGYQWPKIAQANRLSNPGLIHVNNTLIIPR